MIRFALFGAGNEGRKVLRELGKEKVSFCIDNNKTGEIDGVPIYDLIGAKTFINEKILVLVTSSKYRDEMIKQLNECGIRDFLVFTSNHISGSNIERRLNEREWGKIYINKMDQVLKKVISSSYSPWTQEILKITNSGDSVLEIGCGSGESSLALAKEGRKVSSLDYSQVSIEIVQEIANKCELNLNTFCLDATGELPFENQQFDFVFHAGLLEHFYFDERVDLLKKWKRICKTMISMVPNADCIPYRVWKDDLEKKNIWKYGIEMPQKTLYQDFLSAGYKNIKEYTIGSSQVIKNLPEDHYIRKAFECMREKGYPLDEWGQGYLLVTIGSVIE